MKIKQIEIMNYKQFKNLSLDLTYPKGHPKEGEGLDKICIIGQSGTGKTNLLDIIKKSVIDFSHHQDSYKPFSEFVGEATDDKYITNTFVTKLAIEVKSLFTKDKSQIDFTKNDDLDLFSDFEKIYLGGVDERISTTQVFNLAEYQQIINRYSVNINRENIWPMMKSKIKDYQILRNQYNNLLTSKLVEDDSYSKEDYKQDILYWESKNENLLGRISFILNDILKYFNLELTKIDQNQKSYNELLFKDLSNGNIIEYENLSTGTKNLISTFIPLKIHHPKDSIILIDEPENSFYPDIQRRLTDLYMGEGEDNQVIFATHSPIIASSFEPWEVVELKFDKNNQIYREQYYEGENHIDNYFIDPRMLTWTGILTDVFDLKEDSNFSFREKKLMEYATLKAEIKALKDENEKESKFLELKKISKLLGLKN